MLVLSVSCLQNNLFMLHLTQHISYPAFRRIAVLFLCIASPMRQHNYAMGEKHGCLTLKQLQRPLVLPNPFWFRLKDGVHTV